MKIREIECARVLGMEVRGGGSTAARSASSWSHWFNQGSKSGMLLTRHYVAVPSMGSGRGDRSFQPCNQPFSITHAFTAIDPSRMVQKQVLKSCICFRIREDSSIINQALSSIFIFKLCQAAHPLARPGYVHVLALKARDIDKVRQV